MKEQVSWLNMGCLKLTYRPDQSPLFISKGVDNARKSAQGFISTDPLKDDYPQLTPYQYASNDPVGDVDIDGLEGKFSEVRPRGQTQPSDATTHLAGKNAQLQFEISQKRQNAARTNAATKSQISSNPLKRLE